jgi:hypothetical protein
MTPMAMPNIDTPMGRFCEACRTRVKTYEQYGNTDLVRGQNDDSIFEEFNRSQAKMREGQFGRAKCRLEYAERGQFVVFDDAESIAFEMEHREAKAEADRTGQTIYLMDDFTPRIYGK